MIIFKISGNIILHPSMAVEKLGSGEDPGTQNGSWSWNNYWSRKTTEKETPAWLSVYQSQKSQLLGL